MRVAIVEDDKIQAETLKKYVDDYRRTHDYGTGETPVFGNGETFLGYCENNSADIVFMDIMMPGMDGMTACEKIRERNSSMIIVFVTDMAQFAGRGRRVMLRAQRGGRKNIMSERRRACGADRAFYALAVSAEQRAKRTCRPFPSGCDCRASLGAAFAGAAFAGAKKPPFIQRAAFPRIVIS